MAIGGMVLCYSSVTVLSMLAIVGMTILGTGAALGNPQLSGAVVASAPLEASGMASAVTAIARQGGFAVGVAALGGLMPVSGTFAGFEWIFCLSATVSACRALGSTLLPSASVPKV
jgi:hypothetical protein